MSIRIRHLLVLLVLAAPATHAAMLRVGSDCNLSQTPIIPGTFVIPQFASTTRGSYRIPSNSYAVDLCNSGSATDLDNQSRPYGVRADAGAFEYAPDDRIFAHSFE